MMNYLSAHRIYRYVPGSIIIYAKYLCTPYILLACYIPVVIVSDFNPTLGGIRHGTTTLLEKRKRVPLKPCTLPV